MTDGVLTRPLSFHCRTSAQSWRQRSRLIADAPHGAVWPPLAAVALAAPQQSPETLRQLAALGSGCAHHAAAADESDGQGLLIQDSRTPSAPLPQADIAPAEAAAAATASVATSGASAQRHSQDPAAGRALRRQNSPAQPSRPIDISCMRPQLQRVESGKEAPADSPAGSPRQTLPLQRFALASAHADRSPSPVQLQLRAASQTNILLQLQPQRSSGSTGSILRRTSCDVDYGSAFEAGRRRSIGT